MFFVRTDRYDRPYVVLMLSDGRAQWEDQAAAAVIMRKKHMQAMCWEEEAHPS